MTDIAPNPTTIQIRRLDHEAVIPEQAKRSDAGYDLTSIVDGTVPAGDWDGFGTGIAVAIPEGFVGYIKPRSGLAVRNGIGVLAGVIDPGYRGEVRVVLINHSIHDFTVAAGDRIAQLVIQPVADVAWSEVLQLPESERAAGGFGSTGQR